VKAARDLGERFLRLHPDEAAALLERLPPEQVAALAAEIPAQAAAAALPRMSLGSVSAALALAEPNVAADVAEALPLHAAAAILRAIPAETRETIRARLSPAKAAALERLLRYPEGTAGALMDPLAPGVPADLTIGETVETIRAEARSLRYYVYVVERAERRLAGVVSVRTLLLGDPATPLSAVTERDVESLSARATREAIVFHPAWKRFHALPVVDADGSLLGAIRYETYRALESVSEPTEGASAVTTALELGELFWIGFGGLLSGLATGAAGGRR
jgi:magnesium transporter